MLKKVITFCFISILSLSLIGCSKKNIANEAAGDNQKTISQDNKSTNKEADLNFSTNTEETTSKKAESLSDYFKQKDKILLAGKVNNNLNIHMELKITNKDHFDDLGEPYWSSVASMEGLTPKTRYEGFYYYDKYKQNIRIEAEAYSNGYIAIYEFDEKNNFCNAFGGFIGSDNVLKGTWTNSNGTNYVFYLAKDGTNPKDINYYIKLGEYYTLESGKNNFTSLNIIAATDKEFKFHIFGYSKPNFGNVGSVAYYTDASKKQAVFKDGNNKSQINFSFEDNTIKVSISGNNNYAGAHVTMEGTFKKNESKQNLTKLYLGDD